MGTRRRHWLFITKEFGLLFSSNAISFVGDQFTTVAFPWLVLVLTHSSAQLGFVLAAIALPRAAFMLLGGAYVDRMSPLGVLLATRTVSTLLSGLLAALVLAGAIQMWMVYLIGAAIGLCGAFAYPASSAILPQIVAADLLQRANSIMMGVAQLSMLIGPALAGFLINAGSSRVGAGNDTRGTGLAFAVDAASFLLSIVLLFRMRVVREVTVQSPTSGVLSQVAEGIRTLWGDRQLRSIIGYLALACLLAGPMQVGLPLFARERLSHGAAALGWLVTAIGCGLLLGSLVGTSITRLLRGRVGLVVLGSDAAAGLILAGLSAVHSVIPSAALLVCFGVSGSVGQIAIMTWLQSRVPQAMMGRTMSVVMFTFSAVAPVAGALAGLLLRTISLSSLFVSSGLSLTAFTVLCLTRRNLRAMQLRIVPA